MKHTIVCLLHGSRNTIFFISKVSMEGVNLKRYFIRNLFKVARTNSKFPLVRNFIFLLLFKA